MNIDSMIQGNPQALVTSYNGVLVADSLEVADRFGKRHTHVLRSIDDLINQLESQSTQNWADYFIPDDYQDNKNRRAYLQRCNVRGRKRRRNKYQICTSWGNGNGG